MNASERSVTPAILGGDPLFDRPLPVGQLYFPSWERYEAAMSGIFEREYYTNHGVLARELEERLADYLGVRHAMYVTNATVGLFLAAKAMALTGRVIVPAFSFVASAQALSWAGLEPVFCDVDPDTHHITPDTVAGAHVEGTTGVLGVNLWGGSCDPASLEAIARSLGVHLFFDSAHAFGCSSGGRRLGSFGEMEVFSFHATKVVNATEGGCISTNDDKLAARVRNMRSNYGIGDVVDVPLTINGRISEAQAAIALMSLDDLDVHIEANRAIHEAYRAGLDDVDGISLVTPAHVDQSNYQSVVCVVDEGAFGLTRDALWRALRADNVMARRYFHPGLHRTVPYVDDLPQYVDALPAVDRLCRTVVQLPVGARVSVDDASRIARLIEVLHERATAVRRAVET